jgi:hypothetical protein
MSLRRVARCLSVSPVGEGRGCVSRACAGNFIPKSGLPSCRRSRSAVRATRPIPGDIHLISWRGSVCGIVSSAPRSRPSVARGGRPGGGRAGAAPPQDRAWQRGRCGEKHALQKSASGRPAMAGYTASGAASIPRYAHRRYSTVPPARAGSLASARGCAPHTPTGRIVPAAGAGAMKKWRGPRAGKKGRGSGAGKRGRGSGAEGQKTRNGRAVTAVPQSPNHPPLPMLFTPHSALRIPRWKPPTTTYSVCQNGSPRAEKLST